MAHERLTGLKSTNRTRKGAGIGIGDVIRFHTADGELTEGIVTGHPVNDRNGIPRFTVEDENGKTHHPNGGGRVDPPYEPDDGPIMPFDDRMGW